MFSPTTPENNQKHQDDLQAEYRNQYRIYYEDTDAGGVVYYANYLKFYERTRTDFLRQAGLWQQKIATELQLLFVVRNCHIDYLKPAKLDDLITVTVKTLAVKTASLIFQQQIFNSNQQLLNRLQVEVVAVDALSFYPKKIPQSLKNTLYVQ